MLSRETIRALVDAGQDEIDRLARQIGKPVSIDYGGLVMLGRVAVAQQDPAEYMREHVRIVVDGMIQHDPDAPAYEFAYERPKSGVISVYDADKDEAVIEVNRPDS